MKKITGVFDPPGTHWVGDGFPVRSLFSYDEPGAPLSPFLLLDHAGPAHFEPAAISRGVGEHPHRGFETVTIVYQGEVEHRDSTGSGGLIGPGDVQWMTAANGIIHDEFHSEAFSRRGGTLEMVQLWVNLPARHKKAEPGYQTLSYVDIPDVALAGDAGRLRVIAGEFNGHKGPARTFTPMNVWDLRLNQGASPSFSLQPGHTLALVILRGTVLVNDREIAREGQLVRFERDNSELKIEADSDATLLVLSGEPIDEPVVGHGPFVMNSGAEIVQAIKDFNNGQFGHIRA